MPQATTAGEQGGAGDAAAEDRKKEGVVNRDGRIMQKTKLAREVGQGIVVLALSGTSVGSVLGMVALATRALGR